MQLRRILINLSGCSNALNDAEQIREAMSAGVGLCGATLRQECIEKFNPHGCTIMLILAESHFVVSTWPEHRFATLDAALCNEDMDIDALVAPVLELFVAETISREVLTVPIA